MARLPDLEGLAIFAKVAECRFFADAAAELRLSKATVSKAVSRIESRLGARLIIRTARSFELTDAGRQLAVRAVVRHLMSWRVCRVGFAERGLRNLQPRPSASEVHSPLMPAALTGASKIARWYSASIAGSSIDPW